MGRRKLVEYLNNPSLLDEISVEDMQAWAQEVPYAGLIQKLLTQKLALEGSDKASLDKAHIMALMSNANPDHVVNGGDGMKQMINEHPNVAKTPIGSDQPLIIGNNEEGGIIQDQQEIIKPDHDNDSGYAHANKELEQIVTPNDEDMLQGDHQIVELNIQEVEEDSGFMKWLAELDSLESKPEEPEELELRDKELASAALAELLVNQGHYQKAIEMYELLIVKNPQKSSFFAAQIQKVKAL